LEDGIEMFMRSDGETEPFVIFHVVTFDVVIFDIVIFDVVPFPIIVFKSGMLHAANAVCIDAIQSSTPTNRDAALILLDSLIFLTPG
jgi:hypothetical protein